MTEINGNEKLVVNLAQLVARLTRIICNEYVETSGQYKVAKKAQQYLTDNCLNGSILRTQDYQGEIQCTTETDEKQRTATR